MSEAVHAPGSLTPTGGYRVDLLLSTPSTVPWEALAGTLSLLDPNARVAERRVTFPGEPPSSIEIREGAVDEDLGGALAQTWDWPQASHALSHVAGRVTVEEAPGAVVTDRFERLRRFTVTLRALLENLPVTAIHWRPSQRLVEPHNFVERLAHGSSVTDHAVNVRLFQVPDGQPGEVIMDTFGLTPFGVPDLQVHFAGLDPMDVAPILLHYAEYVFEKGDVFGDDDLVRGIEAYEEWTCERQHALAPPVRPVVDIKPDRHAIPH